LRVCGERIAGADQGAAENQAPPVDLHSLMP